MKKMGIRRSGLLVNSTLIIDTLYKLSKVLNGFEWMVTGCVANQLWIYLLAGNCMYCRPTDNLDLVGVNIIRPIEELYGVIAEGFEGDSVRRLSFLVSHDPKFKINIESYSSPIFIDELKRRVVIPFNKQSIPVISMEDQIVSKLSIGRREDIIDVSGLLRAYKRYLRANIIFEHEPQYIIHFSTIKDIVETTYPDIEEDIFETFENISGTPIDDLIRYENSPRKLIDLLHL